MKRPRCSYHARVGTRPGASPLSPRPVRVPKPYWLATSAMRSSPTRSASDQKYTLHECWMAPISSSLPWAAVQSNGSRSPATW